jgi:DNA-binding IscR family transcriptional regulator
MLSLHTKYALQALAELAETEKSGGLTLAALRERCVLPNRKILARVVRTLKKAGYIAMTGKRYRADGVISDISLFELCNVMDEEFCLRQEHLGEGWSDAAVHKHMQTMILDTKLTVELTDLYRRIPLTDLFPGAVISPDAVIAPFATRHLSDDGRSCDDRCMLPQIPAWQWLEV